MTPLLTLIRTAGAFALAGMFLLPNAGAAEPRYDGPMRFALFTPCTGNADACAPTVLAEGRFEPATATYLEAFLARERDAGRLPDRVRVAFDSPGGDLWGALSTGLLLRKLRAWTVLAPTYHHETVTSERVLRANVRCASACPLAFVGGERRELALGARLGVHQFYAPAGSIGDARTQSLTTQLARYLDEMGIDRRLLDLALSTPRESMHYLSRADIETLGLDNTTPQFTPWALAASPSGRAYAHAMRYHPATGVRVLIMLGGEPTRHYLVIAVRSEDTAWPAPRITDALSGTPVRIAADGLEIALLREAKWESIGDMAALHTHLSDDLVQALRSAATLTVQTSPARPFSHLSVAGRYPLEGLERFIRTLTRTH